MELVVENLVAGGEGLARRADGLVVFVPRTAPGDAIKVEALEARRGTWLASRWSLLTPGPDRCVPACSYAERCGGCDWMHLTLAAQERHKVALIEGTVKRFLPAVALSEPVRLTKGSSPLAYRSRLRLAVDAQGAVGFRAPRSHSLVLIESCQVARPAVNALLGRLLAISSTERARLRGVEEVELLSADTAPELVLRLSVRPGVHLDPSPLAAELAVPVVVVGSREDDDLLQRHVVWGALSIEAPVSAFTQVNPEVNRELVSTIVELAETARLQTFVDAFAGAGNFTLPLLGAGLRGLAIDCVSSGILAARSVARDLGLPFDGFEIGDAAVRLKALARSKRRFDLVLLDPPRSGAPELLEPTLALRPRVVALVGCDPVALARDLRAFVERGAKLTSLQAFDMFPQTHHVETLAWLEFTPA